jgi:hypothetical protein
MTPSEARIRACFMIVRTCKKAPVLRITREHLLDDFDLCICAVQDFYTRGILKPTPDEVVDLMINIEDWIWRVRSLNNAGGIV